MRTFKPDRPSKREREFWARFDTALAGLKQSVDNDLPLDHDDTDTKENNECIARPH